MSRVYSSTYKEVAKTAETDLFEIVAAAGKAVELISFHWGQNSDYGDAAAEGLTLTFVRGYTTTGSGGSTNTPTPLSSSDGAAAATVKTNNSTVATAGTPLILHSEAVDVQAGSAIIWLPENRPVVAGGERLVVRMGAPADSITQSGTLYFREL